MTATSFSLACTGPGPIAVAPIHPNASFTSVTISGAARNDKDCQSYTTDPAPLVTLCSVADELHLVNSSITGISISNPADAWAALTIVSSSPVLLVDALAATAITNLTGLCLIAPLGTSTTVANSTFTDITSPDTYGGGLIIAVAGGGPTGSTAATSVLLAGSTFTRCRALAGGGARLSCILDEAESRGNSQPLVTTIHDTVFRGCVATGQGGSYGGGGLRVNYTRVANVEMRLTGRNLFDSNEAADGGGLQLQLDYSASPKVLLGSGSRFVNNTATVSGSGATVALWQMRHADVTVASAFEGNAINGVDEPVKYAGALYVLGWPKAENSSVRINGGARFIGNTGSDRGGGMALELQDAFKCSVTITDKVVFERNTAANFGGGAYIFFVNSSDSRINVLGNSVFRQNYVNRSGGGLAVRAEQSTRLSMNVSGRVLFTGNYVNYTGGGMDLNLTASARCSAFVGGAARFLNGSAKWGGGISVLSDASNGTSVAVSGGALIAHNVATVMGGGLYMFYTNSSQSVAVLEGHIRVVNNTVLGYESSGGGVRVDMDKSRGARLVLRGSAVFHENVAQNGSGGALSTKMTQSNGARLLMQGNLTFSSNSAAEDFGGGAVALFQQNSTGSGLVLDGPMTFVDNNAGYGGALNVYSGATDGCAVNITGGLFVNNSAMYNAGAVMVGFTSSSDGRVDVQDARFLQNTADLSGGGMSLLLNEAENTTAALHNVVFERNTVSNSMEWDTGGGGGLLVDFKSSTGTNLSVSDCRWEGNTAAQRAGALLVYANSSLLSNVSMSGLQFLANQADTGAGGGAVLVLGPATENADNDIIVSLRDAVFQENVVDQGVGGGLYVEGSSMVSRTCYDDSEGDDQDDCMSVFMTNVTLHKNAATYGGGLYAINSQLALDGGNVTGNSASLFGGGACIKLMQMFKVINAHFSGNSAGQQGGAIYSVVGDDFSSNRLNASITAFTRNTAQGNGGALYLQGGQTTLSNVSITSNSAREQGGGIAFINLCNVQKATITSKSSRLSNSSCFLSMTNTTRVQHNTARSGGGVFVGAPGNLGVDFNEVEAAVQNNTAMYSASVSVAPDTLRILGPSNFTVAGSTSVSGLIKLNARVGRPSSPVQSSIRVLVEFCHVPENGDKAYLTGTVVASGTKADPGLAAFGDLRLLAGSKNKTYCLRVTVPDYPTVAPQQIYVKVRDCVAGEVRDPIGCKVCDANQYSFSPEVNCTTCERNAVCDGGAMLVPKAGYWHRAFNSARVQPCPNRNACQGDRDRNTSKLFNCHAHGNCSNMDTTVYQALQCSKGYTGNLCGSCDKAQNYGLGLYLRCSKCMPRHTSVALVLIAIACCCGVVVFVGWRSLVEISQVGPSVHVPPSHTSRFSRRFRSRTASQTLPPPPVYDGAQPQPQPAAAAAGASGAALPRGATAAASDAPAAAAAAAAAAASDPPPALVLRRVPPSESMPSSTGARKEVVLGTGSRRSLELSEVFKVVVVHLQYLCIIGNLLIDWPKALRYMVEVVRLMFATSSSSIVSWDCLGSIGNGAAMLLSVITPLAVVLLACGMMAWISREWRGSTTQPGMIFRAYSSGFRRLPGAKSITLDCVVATALVGVFLFYSVLVSASLSAFSCINVDGKPHWIKDMSVQCWTRPHLRAALPVGLLGTVAFCMLLPAVTFWWLVRNRKNLDKPAFRRRYGYLYRLYRPKYMFWEGIVCFQIMALVGVDLFARRLGPFYQLVLLVLLLLFNYSLVVIMKPFRIGELQRLFTGSIFTLLLTCLGVQSLLRGYSLDGAPETSAVHNVVGVVVLLANLAFVLLCTALMLQLSIVVGKNVGKSVMKWVSTRRSTGNKKKNRLLSGYFAPGCLSCSNVDKPAGNAAVNTASSVSASSGSKPTAGSSNAMSGPSNSSKGVDSMSAAAPTGGSSSSSSAAPVVVGGIVSSAGSGVQQGGSESPV